MIIPAGQLDVARAFDSRVRAEVCRFAPLASLSSLASLSVNPEVKTLPYGENLLFVALASVIITALAFGKSDSGH